MIAATRSTAPLRLLVLGLIAGLLTLAAAALAPDRADAARTRCNGTFRVLHNDHIGKLSLPKGNYRITILSSGRPSCDQASALFTRFLEDWDGKLPGGWKVGVRDQVFYRAPGVGFNVKRVGRGGGGGEGEESGGRGHHPANGRFCPGTFRVLNNDRIGPLRLAKGRYWIILLRNRGLSCKQASRLFTRFLQDYDGNLPPPWVLEPQTASFLRSASGVGFRVKPVS